MALVLLGINHNTADVGLRERVAFPPEKMADAMQGIAGLEHVEEAVIVSTCNRTELYLDVDLGPDFADDPNALMNEALMSVQQEKLLAWLADYHGLEPSQLAGSSYFHWRDDVVRHLMRVACGLDSMVLGEPQILGQIKSAYAVARELGAARARLGKAFQEAFSIAKQVRTDTAIGENPVSVAYAAVTLAEQIFSNLGELRALLIGAGHTIELVARHLTDRGVKEIIVANRTLENAVRLGDKFGGEAILLSEIPDRLARVDIVVSSTNSQLPLLGKGAVERAVRKRKHRPILLLDLAVPRDIEPEVGNISDAYLYTVDDIRDVIEDSVRSRSEAAAQAASIIERGVEEYARELRSLNAVATLRAFRDTAESIREAELEKARKALERGQPAVDVLESLSRGITNKLLHSPSVKMKQASAEGRDELVSLTRELFDLDGAGAEMPDRGKKRS